ncbi:MAG: hypothetical protein QOG80_1972, partial [Pseudonocardiales bacterium]|nr:hypothetical protein [Pseudonocardiales bacterium]
MKQLRLTRSMLKYWVLAVGVCAVALLVVSERSSQAITPDVNAQAIQTGLSSFASDAVAKLGLPATATADHLSYLTQQIPLSKLQPLGASGLDIASANNPLAQAFADTAGSISSTAGLAAALNSINQTYAGVNVTLGCGDGTSACGHPVTISAAAPYTITVPINATRNVAVPLSLTTDLQDLTSPDDATHDLTVHLSVSATLSFGYDSTRPASHQFFLNSPSGAPASLNVAASVTGPATDASFGTDLGFTKINLTPHINSASVGFAVQLNSPHGVGDSDQDRITSYDWQTMVLQDLVTITRSGSVSATLAMDTTLTALNPDVTVTVTAGSADGFVPHFAVGGGGAVANLSSAISSLTVSDFLNITPTQVLTGLGQLAAAVQALQTAADIHLPFMQNGLTSPTGTSALKLVNDLITSLAQQTVGCGTDNTTSPPSGTLIGLPAGTPIYCSATTTDSVDAGSITWSAVADTAQAGSAPNNVSGSGADGTVASVPTKLAVFTTKHDDVPPIIIANYTAASVAGGVSMPVPTAQDLFDQLTSAAGLGDTVGGHAAPGLSYDSTTHALKFHLVKRIATPANITAALDFADRLKGATGLFSLSADSGASVTAQASGVVLDLTFGVILTKNLADITPHSTPPTQLDRFFVVGPPSGDILSVDNASVAATVKLKGQVGFLGVTGAGSAVADCTGATSTAFCITKDDASKPIIAISLVGSSVIDVGGQSIGGNALPIATLLTHLTDHTAITPNLKFAGGLSISADLGGTQLAHGGVSFLWPVDSIGELTSATNLTVTTDADFGSQLKTFWEMAKNDPTALLQVILNGLRDLAQKEAATSGDSGSVFDTQLPLVNTSPRQLMQQFTRLQSALDEIATGSGALVDCTNVTGATASPVRDASSAVGGDVIDCTATVTTGAPTSVTWTVLAAGNPITVTNSTDTATIGATPTQHVEFTLPANIAGFASSSTTAGYHVHIDYADPTNSHTGDLPALSAPTTLQGFANYLAAKLGLPADVLTLAMISTPKPGGGGAVNTLKVGLKYDICTADTNLVSDCGGDGLHIATPTLPINASLGDVGGGLTPSIQTAGSFALQFNAHAELDLGFPLDGGIGTLPTPEVLGSTSASIEVAAGSNDLGASASLGPLSVALGSQAAVGHDNTGATRLQKFHVGGKVTVGEPGATADTAYTPGDFASGLHIAFADNGAASDCGNVDPHYGDEPVNAGDPADPTLPVDQSGFACAAVTMNLNGTFIGDLGFRWSSFSAAPTITLPDDLGSRIAGAAFNVDFLLKAMPQLLDDLQKTLSNAAGGNQKLPVIGDALDAGSNLVGTLKTGLVDPVVNGLSAAIGAVGSPSEITDKVDQFLFDQLASGAQGATGAKVGILLDS